MTSSRREFVQTISLAGLAAALGGCEQASESLLGLIAPEPRKDFRPPEAHEIDLVSHIINRLTWGPAPGEYQRIKAMGVEAFIREQLDPQSLEDRRADLRVAELEDLAEPTPELYNVHPQLLLEQMTRGKVMRGVYSHRQLFEVMVDFWTDHFNVFSGKGDCKWLKAADDRDVIRPHALGKFRDLLRASAISPAMLIYLDGHANRVDHPGDRPNENYARELMELHTLGVHGGYTQQDVREVARCLSGWTYGHHVLRFKQAHVEFDGSRHDAGEKTVLGHHFPPGGGDEELERVLDVLSEHPSTAKFIAGKLCRRFVAEEPGEATMRAVADAFAGTGGDIKATLEALFQTSEFRESRGGLFKRPAHFVISALRATDAQTRVGPDTVEMLRRMGHAPFEYPTPDGYPQESAPWMGTLLWRWAFALRLAGGGLTATSVDAARLAERMGSTTAVLAHLMGRQPTALVEDVVTKSGAPLAIALASPAFQRF